MQRLVLAAAMLLGPALAGSQAEGLSPASALGPEIAVGAPENGYVGKLTVVPEHGPAGTPVHVAGEGFPAAEEVELVWRTVKGRWKVAEAQYHGREYVPVAYLIARVRTDRAGRFTADFRTPEDFGFSHDIVVQQGKRLFTQAAYSIDMTVSLSSGQGPVGVPITVDIRGIGWRSLQNSWQLLYDNRFTGWISAVSTAGTAHVTIPAAGRPGLHMLEVVHGEFTFPYRNMQQSPEPGRPQFALPFMVTDGPPVLPPAAEVQVQSGVRGLPAAGSLTISPPFGAVGARIVARGQGFTPGGQVMLNWTSVAGNRVGGNGWQETSRPIAEATADDAGQIELQFAAPDDLGGAHQLSAPDGRATQSGSFWITPSAVSLIPAEGEAGTPFKIRLKGVGWTETANIYTIVYDNSYVGYACGFNSQGDVEIPLYATGEPGWHFIDLYPAIYKGKESKPRNFRIPQLTYAADHPGEDLPRFRFAFRVTAGETRNVPTR
jgi:hypothetical protein